MQNGNGSSSKSSRNCGQKVSRIKWLRVSRDMTIKQIADEIGVSTSAWQWWERGSRVPRDEYIQRLNEFEAGGTPDSERINRRRVLEHPEWTADRIKQLRIDLGYKQSEIAGLVGVAVQSWSLWETGINRPKPENIARLIELDGGGREA
jgi:transcriptional regulator with XRE-family HTH domain